MDKRIETGREFWRAVLLAGGATAIPRWTLDPAPGVAEHVATLDDDLAAAVRRLADELELPLHSVALAAHAKVLAALSGEQDVVTGYAAGPEGRPLPCPLTTEARSWRSLLQDTARVEADLLQHRDFAVDELERELGVAGPAFETEFDPIGSLDTGGNDQHRPRRGRRAPGGARGLRRPARAAPAVPHRRARRGQRREDRRLPPHRPRADGRRPGRRARAGEPAVGRGAALPARRAGRAAPGAAGPPVPRAVRAARADAPGRRRGRAPRPAVDLSGAQRARQPAGAGAAGARAAPRGRGRGGDRAEPGLDGRRHRDLQGRWRVSADRAVLPGRSDRDHAGAGRVHAGADRARQHHHARQGPRHAARRAEDHHRGRLRRGPCRRRPGRRRGGRSARLHLLHVRLHRRAQGGDVRARRPAQPPQRQDRRPGGGPGARRARGRPDRAAVLRHLAVATGVGAPGRGANPDRRAGGDPRRRAVRRHDRPRPGRRPAGRPVLSRGRADLPRAASPESFPTCGACRPPARR